MPLVTDLGDPLLSNWQFGLGKVTAFTSDCKSRWAALWITGWPSYSQFWAQVLRETARKPQSQTMDMRLVQNSPQAAILVDLLEDPAHFRNDAAVTADVYFVAAGALGSSMETAGQIELGSRAREVEKPADANQWGTGGPHMHFPSAGIEEPANDVFQLRAADD